MIVAPHKIAVAHWQILAAGRRTGCAACRQAIHEGELFALDPTTRLPYHPHCAGPVSSGAVVSPAPMRVGPVS